MPFLASVRLSYSDLTSELGPRASADETGVAQLTRSSRISRFDGSFDLTYLLRFGGLRAGGFLRASTLRSALGGLFQNITTERENATEAGLYLQPEFTAGGLRVSPGVRLTTLPQQGQAFVEPRLRAAFETGAHRLSLAAGLYNQPIVGLSDRRDATSVFTVYTVAPDGQTPPRVAPHRRLPRQPDVVGRRLGRGLRQAAPRPVGRRVHGRATAHDGPHPPPTAPLAASTCAPRSTAGAPS